MIHKTRNMFVVLCLTSLMLAGWTLAQQPVTQTAVSDQPGLLSHLQALGIDIDHTTLIIIAIGSAVIATGAMGLNAIFVLFMLFGRPILQQMLTQLNNGQPGSNPMEALTAAAGNAMKNLFGGQDLTAIIAKLINTILPTLLRTTSQFVTDQANGQMG
jgi:hypothetical protein